MVLPQVNNQMMLDKETQPVRLVGVGPGLLLLEHGALFRSRLCAREDAGGERHIRQDRD
jgi:hypothetical protein